MDMIFLGLGFTFIQIIFFAILIWICVVIFRVIFRGTIRGTIRIFMDTVDEVKKERESIDVDKNDDKK